MVTSTISLWIIPTFWTKKLPIPSSTADDTYTVLFYRSMTAPGHCPDGNTWNTAVDNIFKQLGGCWNVDLQTQQISWITMYLPTRVLLQLEGGVIIHLHPWQWTLPWLKTVGTSWSTQAGATIKGWLKKINHCPSWCVKYTVVLDRMKRDRKCHCMMTCLDDPQLWWAFWIYCYTCYYNIAINQKLVSISNRYIICKRVVPNSTNEDTNPRST